jgi:hypothetical protein
MFDEKKLRRRDKKEHKKGLAAFRDAGLFKADAPHDVDEDTNE